MTPRIAAILKKLAGDGASVLGPKPSESPSLSGYPACDTELRAIAEDVWGNLDGETVYERPYGKGRIYTGVSIAKILDSRGPDVKWTAGDLVWQHRRIGTHDFYFIANQQTSRLSTELSLRIEGKVPELWHAESGRIETAGVWRVENGRTIIPLNLDPCESVFIAFRQPGYPVVTSISGGEANVCMTDKGIGLLAHANGSYKVTTSAGTKTVAVTAVPEPVTIEGPWTVTFPPDRGAPQSAVFDRLVSWTERPEDGIRFFSGTAIYRREIEVPSAMVAEDTKVFIDLGKVEVIAELFINGENAGILWKPPFRAELTRFLRSGPNQLEIRLTNLWPNRLIGDEFKPAYITKWIGGRMAGEWPDWIMEGKNVPDTGRVTFTTWRHYTKESPLVPSGLLGPVSIHCAKIMPID
jgi:hypothetical protein